MKRLHNLTDEPVDMCLARGLITQSQHWCAVHLRWLYTLKFGAPSVRALDPLHMGGIDTKAESDTWRAQREREYELAIATAQCHCRIDLLLDVCIYSMPPAFLRKGHTVAGAYKNERQLQELRAGLDALCDLWKIPGEPSGR